ncbi:hypothetical protein B0H13DRAFT_2428251 [Mycena leptocephala]|nr:hypothetical protein B0H13DRAFT_2428251 [Mycena leptocephala]
MLSCPVVYAGSTALVPGAAAPMPPCPSSLTAAWAMIRPSLLSHARRQEPPRFSFAVTTISDFCQYAQGIPVEEYAGWCQALHAHDSTNTLPSHPPSSSHADADGAYNEDNNISPSAASVSSHGHSSSAHGSGSKKGKESEQWGLLYTFPQSVGIAVGRPSSSYYFVGVQDDGLFCLDPHHSRPTVPLRPFAAEPAPSIPRPPSSSSHGHHSHTLTHSHERRSLSPEAAYARGGSPSPQSGHGHNVARGGSLSPELVWAHLALALRCVFVVTTLHPSSSTSTFAIASSSSSIAHLSTSHLTVFKNHTVGQAQTPRRPRHTTVSPEVPAACWGPLISAAGGVRAIKRERGSGGWHGVMLDRKRYASGAYTAAGTSANEYAASNSKPYELIERAGGWDGVPEGAAYGVKGSDTEEDGEVDVVGGGIAADDLNPNRDSFSKSRAAAVVFPAPPPFTPPLVIPYRLPIPPQTQILRRRTSPARRAWPSPLGITHCPIATPFHPHTLDTRPTRFPAPALLASYLVSLPASSTATILPAIALLTIHPSRPRSTLATCTGERAGYNLAVPSSSFSHSASSPRIDRSAVIARLPAGPHPHTTILTIIHPENQASPRSQSFRGCCAGAGELGVPRIACRPSF